MPSNDSENTKLSGMNHLINLRVVLVNTDTNFSVVSGLPLFNSYNFFFCLHLLTFMCDQNKSSVENVILK